MWRLLAAIFCLAAFSGCALEPAGVASATAPPTVTFENPMFIPGTDFQRVWETIVDVVDDYFRIEREEPVRLVGNVLTEGRLDTFPEVSSTIFEPWRRDSATSYDKIEATLQTMRRYAKIRVVPAEGGFWVDVAVYKELENMAQPEQATAGRATFPTESTQVRIVNPIGSQEMHLGWDIPKGRDPNLEQLMLCQLRSRLSGVTPTYVGSSRQDPPARPAR
jgi:hypothetical protein